MRIRTWSTVVLVLLLSGIVVTAFSASVFIRIDQFVHSDLYRFGLKFDNEWARGYWTNAGLMFSLLAAAVIAASAAIALFQFSVQTGKVAYVRLISSLPLAAGMAMIALTAFVFTQIDYFVQNGLFRYGLQFNYEWVGQFWLYSRLMFGLLELTILAIFASIVLILKGPDVATQGLLARGHIVPRADARVDSAEMITLVLLSTGPIAFAFSVSYSSSVLALIGLGLVFWGAILFYIRPKKYIRESIIARISSSSSLAGLDEILRELGYKYKGIYLPRRYLGDSESCKIYMSARGDSVLPAPEEIQKQKGRVFLDDPGSMLITPPGAELARLLEETLKTSFANVDLQHLEERLPGLLTEELQIVENFEIESQESRVRVKMKSSLCRNMHKEAGVLMPSHIYYSLGCALCSAIATALAETTGKPVIIERELVGADGETSEIHYRLLE